MALSLYGISYTEFKTSGPITIGEGKSSAVRIFDVAWTNRLQFMRNLRGTVTNISGQVVTTPRARYPGTNLFLTSMKAVGSGEPGIDGDDMIDFPKARITATYEWEAGKDQRRDIDPEAELEETEDDQDPSIDTLISRMTFGVDVLETPSEENGFKFGTTYSPGDFQGKKITQAVPIYIPYIDYAIPIAGLGEINKEMIRSRLGCCNQGMFQGADGHCVLFLGATAELISNNEDGKRFNMELNFRERSKSWNFIYVPAAEDWCDLDPEPYTPKDFEPLLKLNQPNPDEPEP